MLTPDEGRAAGGIPLLRGEALFCGYYLNELLMHLLPRKTPTSGFSTAIGTSSAIWLPTPVAK